MRGASALSHADAAEAVLVARLAGGDDDVLGEIYDRYGRAVYSLALRIVREGAAAEELTQEVFVRLWRAAASFDPAKGAVATWLLRITHNLALNEIRRQKSRPQSAQAFDWDVDGAALADADSSGDPASRTIASLRSRHEAGMAGDRHGHTCAGA